LRAVQQQDAADEVRASRWRPSQLILVLGRPRLVVVALVAQAFLAGCLRGGGVNGVVRDTGGNPVPDVRVTWTYEGADVTTTTGLDGTYRIFRGDISPFSRVGSAKLVASRSGYLSAAGDAGLGPWRCEITLASEGGSGASNVRCVSLD
jgi:hypothetical protein